MGLRHVFAYLIWEPTNTGWAIPIDWNFAVGDGDGDGDGDGHGDWLVVEPVATATGLLLTEEEEDDPARPGPGLEVTHDILPHCPGNGQAVWHD